VDPARDGWNLYGYVGGNPVNYTDPTGLITGSQLADQIDSALSEYDAVAAAAYTDGSASGVALTTLSGSGADFLAGLGDVLRLGDGIAAAILEEDLTPLQRLGGVFQDLMRGVTIASPATGRTFKGPGKGASKPPGVPSKPRVNKLGPDPGAQGAHTRFKRGPDGKVQGYTEFDAQGNSVKRFRGSGRQHGGQEPPLILEPKPGKGPGSPLKVPRTPKPEELPSGY